MITFRLSDALPRSLLRQWEDELNRMEPGKAQAERERRLAEALDSGLGACWLRDPRVAAIVQGALLHFDGQRYALLAWCIMPNHVHALIEAEERFGLSEIVHSWKSFTAQHCNMILNRTGQFWARDFHDRFIRNDEHLMRAAAYIESNPVKAQLASRPEAWPWSSAAHRAVLDTDTGEKS